MKEVEQISGNERRRLRELVLSVDAPELRVAGTSQMVVFTATEAARGVNVVGTRLATNRLDVTARKLRRSWQIEARLHGHPELLDAWPAV